MTTKKISKQTAWLYCITFLIPVLLYSAIILCYHLGIGKIYPNTFTAWRIPLLGIASMAFLYYLQHTKRFHIEQSLLQMIFSISYGLSSYILAQESEVLHILVYALFPVLFLTFEWMTSDQKHFPFIICSAVLLLLDPAMSIPALLLLYVLALLELSLNHRLQFGTFVHITLNVLFAFLIGCFRIIYYLIPYYDQHDIYGYGGFQITNSPAIFLSRFLPGSISSRQFFFSHNKIDLYCGMFVVFLAILFFFQKKTALRTRVYYGIYSLLLIAALELSPIQYVLNLFVTTEKNTILYSFILIFWILRLACESCTNIGQTSRRAVGGTMILSGGILGISWCFGQHNFLHWMFVIHLLLWGAIGILLLFVNATKQQQKSMKIMALLLFFELCFNTTVLTNLHCKPATVANTAKFFYENTAQETSDATSTTTASDTSTDNKDVVSDEKKDTITASEYTSYISQHTDKNTVNILSDLKNLNVLKEEEYQKYSGKLLPNDFEQLNAICHKLGIADDLFTPYDTTLVFQENPEYQVTDLGNQIYHITSPSKSSVTSGYIAYTIQSETKTSDPVYTLDNSSADLILLDEAQLSGNQYGYLQAMLPNKYIPYSLNYQILFYSMDESILNQLPDLITKYTKETENKSYISYDIIGLVFSYAGLMLLFALLFFNHKEQVYQKLYQIRTTLNHAPCVRKIGRSIADNKIYYLAFLLPALLITVLLICTDCTPFGSNSIFDEDGIGLVLPGYLDHYYNAQDGNTYLSMNTGYATNTYSNTPLVGFSGLYKLLTVTQVILFQHIILILCIGFAGVTMVFYLTHRHSRPVPKQDIRLLLPALIYALNAYMLRCHSFNTWFYVYLLFPVLLIALQRLLDDKKWFAYTAILACCMIVNVQLSLYICIFLVIIFFTNSFRSLKDFLGKGIRFACSSALAAGCSFFVLANTLIASQQLYYKETDSVLPKLGLHGNFLTEWKNYMIYSPSTFVSQYDGDLFAYCGIITLFLALAYFIHRKYNWREKISRLLPILFLCVSFNGQVLSYLWNGLHYQSNVPNRYTFLLMFLLAEVAYDGFVVIYDLSRRTFSMIAVCIIVFFIGCQSYDTGNTTLAFMFTMLLCVLYLFLHLRWKQNHRKQYYTIMILFLSMFELFSNGIYTGKNWLVNAEQCYGDFRQHKTFLQELQNDSQSFFRCIYPGNSVYNYGQVYHTYTNTAFNSFVSIYQANLNQSYGFQSGSNYIYSYYSSNQMGLALSSTKYIFLNDYNTPPIRDLEQYNYIGFYNGYYVYENPNYLSLGIRVPETALDYDQIYEDVAHDLSAYYHNLLAGEYLQTDQSLCAMQPINWDENATNAANSFYFTDENNHILSFDEASAQYNSLTSSKKHRLKMHISFEAPCDGYVYLYANELDGIGYVHKGDHFTTTMDMPNLNDAFSSLYYMVVLKQDLFDKFYKQASQNQLEDITIQNDTITGTTNYDEDGYTMLSIPYDKGWSAYIDGKEVDIENPYDTGLYVKTPAGKHTLELKFVPYGMKTSKRITYGFWLFTLFLWFGGQFIKRHKKS